MRALASLVVPVLEPLLDIAEERLAARIETEGRLLREGVLAVARTIAWMAFAAAAAGVGLALVLYGVYLEGAALGRPSMGAFLAGAVALAVAALGALRARSARKPVAPRR